MPYRTIIEDTGQIYLKYDIDFEALKRSFEDNPFFFSKEMVDKYLTRWMEVLNSAEEVDYSMVALDRKIATGKDNGSQIFEQSVIIGNQEIYLHFNVDKINGLLRQRDDYWEMVKNIPITEFLNKEGSFVWTRPQETGSRTNGAIITVRFPIRDCKSQLVIDGNHRIREAIEKGAKEVPTIMLKPVVIMINQMVPTLFDLFFYAFLIDMVDMVYMHASGKYTDEEAWKMSFLNTGKIYDTAA